MIIATAQYDSNQILAVPEAFTSFVDESLSRLTLESGYWHRYEAYWAGPSARDSAAIVAFDYIERNNGTPVTVKKLTRPSVNGPTFGIRIEYVIEDARRIPFTRMTAPEGLVDGHISPDFEPRMDPVINLGPTAALGRWIETL